MASTKMKIYKCQRYLHSKVRKPKEDSSRTYLKAVEYVKYIDQKEESKGTGDHPTSILKSIFSNEIFHNEESYTLKREPNEGIGDVDTKNMYDFDGAIHKLENYKVSMSKKSPQKSEKGLKTVTIDSDGPFECSGTTNLCMNMEDGDKDNAKCVKKHRNIYVKKDESDSHPNSPAKIVCAKNTCTSDSNCKSKKFHKEKIFKTKKEMSPFTGIHRESRVLLSPLTSDKEQEGRKISSSHCVNIAHKGTQKRTTETRHIWRCFRNWMKRESPRSEHKGNEEYCFFVNTIRRKIKKYF